MVKSPNIGYHEASAQGQQRSPVQACELGEQLFTVFQQVNFDPSAIFGGATAFNETHHFATRNQRNHAMLLRLQALREFPDGCPIATGITLDMQQQQILQWCQAMLA